MLDNTPKASYSYHVNTGRLTQMLPEGFGEPFTFMYQANSHLLESIIGPVVTQTVEYEDARDLIKSVTHSGNVGTHYATYSYTNDLLGRRTTKTQNFNNEVKDFDFGYNARSEVTSANETGNTNFQYGFNYDNIGNRISANENGISKSYVTNALNQYTNVDTTFSPTYDADGNQTQIKTTTGIWNVTYNGENRPVKFIQGDTFISMSYDYMGRRFEKIVIVEGNIETFQKFMYDDYLQIEELNGNNESIKSYLWDPTVGKATRPLMLTDHALEQSFFFTHDANKNVTDLIDEGGMVAVHYEYSPFGAITLNTNPSFYNSFTFSSEYFDSELGLIYYNYRHYNPLNGHWISRDPIEEKGGYNLYGIVGNNLISFYDLLGKITKDECVTIYEECYDSCVKNYEKAPWRYRACQAGCTAALIACIVAADAVETYNNACKSAQEAAEWLKNHPEVVIGTLVVVGGVTYIVVTGGCGAPALIPLLAL